MKRSRSIADALTCVLWGCTAMDAKNYAKNSPRLVLESYFARELSGRGGLFGRSGKLNTRMTIKTSGE